MPTGIYERTEKNSKTIFKDGHKPWNFSKKLSENHRRKLSEAHKGNKILDETKIKISQALKGRKKPLRTIEHKQRMSEYNKRMSIKPPSRLGCSMSMIVRERISRALRGKYSREKSWNWLGGISKNLYPSKFNPILKLKIRLRDNFICQRCGMTEKEHLNKFGRVLSVNHIDFDKNNCKEKNLNTLCCICNTIINLERKYWANYFQIKQCQKV